MLEVFFGTGYLLAQFSDRNWLGMALTKFWMASGDIIRDMDSLFEDAGWKFQVEEIGGFGSVHLFVAEKK